MSQKTIKFEIVTPEKVVFKKDILQVSVPTTSGEITILPDHIPLISVLRPGVIELKKEDGALELMSVSGGFIEVMKGKIVILADTAERAEELDAERIKIAQLRAEELKKSAQNVDDVQFADISARLEKELAREKTVNRWRHLKNLDNKN
ncbi:MAG: ATP synthase F1 subunit epsilon [Patescibacteria group bacterium]|jgi:F-type H+-transporting ATPase subunit epsilon